jgi:electron transfer flavoprotein beta subunit
VRIAVCVAAVPNPEKVAWDRFRQSLDLEKAEPVLNPPDRNALEMAAQLAKQTGSTFFAVSAGAGASAALREAAVFGADPLVALSDPLLDGADECGVAAALAAAIRHHDGADIVFCGAAAATFGSGAVPGLLSAHLGMGLFCDVIGATSEDERISVTCIASAGLARSVALPPAVLSAAPYGVSVRAMSAMLLVRAAKKPIRESTLAEVGAPNPLPSNGVLDGPIEPTRKKRANETVDPITLVAALRDRALL